MKSYMDPRAIIKAKPREVPATYRRASLGIVDRMLRFQELREKAKGKGPAARVAAHRLSQIRGEGGRPL